MITQERAFSELKAVGESIWNSPESSDAAKELVWDMILTYNRMFSKRVMPLDNGDGTVALEHCVAVGNYVEHTSLYSRTKAC